MSINIKAAEYRPSKISEFEKVDFEKSNTKKLKTLITPNHKSCDDDDFSFEMPAISIVVNNQNEVNNVFQKNINPIMDKKNNKEIIQTNPRDLLYNYNYHISNFSKNGNLEKCLDMVKKIKNRNLIPNSHSYTPILNIFVNKNDKTGALNFLKEIIKEGFKPDNAVYNTIIKLYNNKNIINFQNELKEISNEDSVQIYDALMSYYVNNNPEKVNELYNEIIKNGLQPTIYTYNAMLNLCAKQGDINKSDELMEKIYKEGLTPTWQTYNFLINMNVKIENENNISLLFKEMKNKKITIPSTVYTTILNFYGSLNNKEKVFELFKEIEGRRIEWDPQICNVYIDLLVKYDKKKEAKHFFIDNYSIDRLIIPPDPDKNMPEKLDVHKLSHGAAYVALQLFVSEKWNKQPFILVTGKGIHSTKNEPYAMSKFLMEKMNENEFNHLAYHSNRGGHWKVFLKGLS